MTDEEIMESIPGWCSRHIPAGLLAGPCLSNWGMSGRQGCEGQTLDTRHGSFPDSNEGCADCLALKRAEVARREEERVWLLANSKVGWPALKR